MRPTLFEIAGIGVQSYGVSKALAALVAGWLLQRELVRRGRSSDIAFPVTVAAVVGGFAGGKLYFLIEQGGGVSMHDLGGSGFTWYGGVIGGAAAVWWVAWRRGVAIGELAGLVAIPLAVAYGIGRLGCLLAGDGTYGSPTDLPWGMSFPDGTVPTADRVHPAPLYEAIAAFAIAGVLWRLRDRVSPPALFGVLAIMMGAERFLVEFVRLNEPVVAGLTAAQIFSLAQVVLGAGLVLREHRVGALRRPRAVPAIES
jgi:phosphatidylglycerol---prolipoprotein diacylglyceryl transferase